MNINNKFLFLALAALLFINSLAYAQEKILFHNPINEQKNAPFRNLIKDEIPQKEFGNLVQGSYTDSNLFSSLKSAGQSAREQETESYKPLSFKWAYLAAPIFMVALLLAYVEFHRKKGYSELARERRTHSIAALRMYAENNLRRGFTKEQIKNALMQHNYNSEEIEEALKGMIRK